MDETIHFQWQNDILRQTIYPLREMKLRDFLVFYEEIDLWKLYKGKTENDADIKAEIEAHKQAQVKIWQDALAAYADHRGHFMSTLTESSWRARYPRADVDDEELAQVNKLHVIFATWLPKISNPRSESYFISQRVYEWETHRKSVAHEISECQRKMRNYEPFPQYRKSYDQQAEKLARLQDRAIKMADAELEALYAFLAVAGRLEKRRTELAAERAAARKKTDDAERMLAVLNIRLAPLEAKLRGVAAELERLKSPPDRAALEQHFLVPLSLPPRDATAAVALKDLDKQMQGAHAALQQALQVKKPPSSLLLTAQSAGWALKRARNPAARRVAELESNLRNMPQTWSHRPERQAEHDSLLAGLATLDAELGRLADFEAALTASARTPAQTASLIEQKEKELDSAQISLDQLRTQLQAGQEQIEAQAKILNTPEQERLTEFSPTQVVTVRDIAKGKAEAYRASLMGLDHKELLELVVQRFLREPERYPLWLQYMVVHFSGMRYASAHGSWADPKDLLMNLRTPRLEEEFKRLDQAAVDALCAERISTYSPSSSAESAGPPRETPALAKTEDKDWQAKVALHLRNMRSVSPYYRRKGLFDLLVDEETNLVEQMTEEQVTDALDLQRTARPIPDWMWREIVAVVPSLRTREVKDPEWERLTPQQQAERLKAAAWKDRLLISLWKQDNLVAWREQHAASEQLLVTRAVCNEVAEHIQHVRGNKPGGGLTAKPQWYLRQVSEAAKGASKTNGEKPFLLRATPANLREGASVLWLRFTTSYPSPWQIAGPMKVSDGQELLPSEYYSGRSGDWRYRLEAGTVKRERTATDASGARVNQVEWLRWIHEATVVEVAETAEGTVVLTFETALPYEDKRLSTIGLFKQDLSYMTYTVNAAMLNPAFVGYAPPGDVPYQNLENMLDWNKILLREAIAPQALQEWRAKQMRKP
jgi:hypothetical protein